MKGGDFLTRGHPDWSDLECMLALWIYHRLDLACALKQKVNKAALYREVSAMIPRRTAKAIEFKVQNVSACDPRPTDRKPIAPLANKQERLQALFDELWPKRRHELEDAYIMARTLTEHGTPLEAIEQLPAFEVAATTERVHPKPIVGATDEGHFFIEEGRMSWYEGDRRTRSSALTKAARDYYRAKAIDGLLRCVVCGISFDRILTDTEVMHIHHLNPIAQADSDGRVLPVKKAVDSVRPVCPTCHAIIHSRNRLLSLEEARNVWRQADDTRRSHT